MKMFFFDSPTPNYFSLEDILVTQERTPCKLLVNAPDMGFLNASGEDKDLQAGITLELPLWMSKALSSGHRPLVAPDLPKIYTEPYREILKADPKAVNLYKFNVNFYNLGCYVKDFDARGEVAAVLVKTFQERFRQIMDLASNVAADSTVMDQLDNIERRLFAIGQETNTKLDVWFSETNMRLEAADMIVNLRKRKRLNETYA